MKATIEFEMPSPRRLMLRQECGAVEAGEFAGTRFGFDVAGGVYVDVVRDGQGLGTLPIPVRAWLTPILDALHEELAVVDEVNQDDG